jgi:phosphoenolpyruvate carboxylase
MESRGRQDHHVPYLDLLADRLDQVVREQAGEPLADQLIRFRRLAGERRVGLPRAEQRLLEEIESYNSAETRNVIRALSFFFDLANLAEDCERIRVLRHRDQQAEAQSQPRRESIADAIALIKNDGATPEAVQRWLDRLHIEPVFTAHPTEAKRRTTRYLLRSLRSDLQQLSRGSLLPHEEQAVLQRMHSELTILWQSDLLRPKRPRVKSEVERGLFFGDGLWDVVPLIYDDLREALAVHFPGHRFEVPAFLKFGTWIGGDRDGHPYVTAEVTAESLATLRRAAVSRHLERCRRLLQQIVMSATKAPVLPALASAVDAACAASPVVSARVETTSETELCRRWLKIIEYRLEQTLAAAFLHPSAELGYRTADELLADVQLLVRSIAAHRGEGIVRTHLQSWLDQIETFGLHFAAMDMRQDSRVHLTAAAEILKQAGVHDDFASLPETEKRSLLHDVLKRRLEIDELGLSPETVETLAVFRLLAQVSDCYGLAPLGGYVISMTHNVSDVLIVQWLWQHASGETDESAGSPVYFPIIPLFETIDDLHRAPQILTDLLTDPAYSRYLTSDQPPTQIVMVGYSDSTKDGGYLAAIWHLHEAQEQMAEIAEANHVRLIVFHGRGGALGRGGGPAARAIRSLPARAVGGALRVTEQGEVLAERYDDPAIAFRHLEQVTWATLLVSAKSTTDVPKDWREALDWMSRQALDEYRRLIEHPGFLQYFDQATPIGEIEQLPIGSRPSRRQGQRALADLRAIPWTFAWTQCRQLIPAWFGLGTAVREFVDRQSGDWSLLETMYDEWLLFRAIVDNAELALAKADMAVAHRYADLVEDAEAADQVWERISAEYAKTRGAVLLISRQHELLSRTGWLRESIQARNPYVDPLNFIQTVLMQRKRTALETSASDDQIDELTHLLRLTVQGIASGLRTTG